MLSALTAILLGREESGRDELFQILSDRLHAGGSMARSWFVIWPGSVAETCPKFSRSNPEVTYKSRDPDANAVASIVELKNPMKIPARENAS